VAGARGEGARGNLLSFASWLYCRGIKAVAHREAVFLFSISYWLSLVGVP
jgi:hypothetical protein